MGNNRDEDGMGVASLAPRTQDSTDEGIGFLPVCPNPVFVVGCPRSGTSVLSHSLAQHAELWLGEESDFLGPLIQRVRDVHAFGTQRGKYHWLSAQGVGYEELLRYIGMGVNALYTQRSGGLRWIEQTPQYTLYLPHIQCMFPGACFVHIVRDARDVVLSMIRSGFDTAWASDFEEACRTWVRFVETALDFESANPGRLLRVKHEDLIMEREAAFRRILGFLGLPYDPSAAELLAQGRMNSSFGTDEKARPRWKETFSDRQKAYLLDVCGNLLHRFGYDTEETSATPSPDAAKHLPTGPGKSLFSQGHPTPPGNTMQPRLDPSSCGATPGVVIAILSWNRVRLLRDCLESIFEKTLYPNARICVLDQGSEDGTADYLQGLGDRIDWIHSADNLGFVGGNNLIFEKYPECDVVLLNNDTIVTEGWLTSLVECAYSEPDIGVVGAKLVYPDGRLQEAGAEIFSDGSGWNIGRDGDPELREYNRRKEVDYCSGACLYVKRRVLEVLQGFDERFSPAYYEDTDLCFSARNCGFRVLYEPSCRVIHLEGATAGVSVLSGAKKHQLVNQGKFVDKWREQLARHRRSFWEAPVVPGREGREKVLVVARTPPMFDRAAGELRLYEAVRILSQHYQVVFLACDATGAYAYIQALRELGVVVYGNDLERFPYIGDLEYLPPVDVEALLTHNSFKAAFLSFHHIANLYIDLIRRTSPETVIVTDSVDVHFLREIREAETRRDGLRFNQALENKRKELVAYERSDLVLTATDADRQQLLKESPCLDIGILPTIHPVPPRIPPRSRRSGLLFIGGFSHPPNVDAVLYFVEGILPLVREQIPGVELTVVGNRPPPEVLAFQEKGVRVTGFVPDTRPYLDAALVSIAPLRYGAGMKGKVGEAMVNGVPVVTTSTGAEGIGVTHREQVLIADSPRSFAAAIVELHQDAALWESLSARGIEFIRDRYSPQAVEREMLKLMRSLPSPRPRKTDRFRLSMEDRERDKCVSPLSKVTVVVATRNQIQTARRCLEAVQRMTEDLAEIFVVDNASIDGTVEWLEQTQIQYVRNERDLGRGTAWLQGLRMASSEFVALLDADTVVTPRWDARLMDHLKRNRSLGAVAAYSDPPEACETLYELEELAWQVHQKERGVLHETEELERHPCIVFHARALDGSEEQDTELHDSTFIGTLQAIRKKGYRFGVARDVLVHCTRTDPWKATALSKGRHSRDVLSVVLCGSSTRENLIRSVASVTQQSWPEALDLIAAVPQALLPIQSSLQATHPSLSLDFARQERVSIADLVDRAKGGYVLVVQGDMILGEGFLKQHMDIHDSLPSEDLAVVGYSEASDPSQDDPLLAYLSNQQEQRRFGVACPPYFGTSVSASKRTFQRTRLRDELGTLWKIREFLYRAGLEGTRVVQNPSAVTHPCTSPSLEELFAEQRRAGLEGVTLARKHPSRIWAYQDYKERVQKDFYGREDLLSVADAVRRDLEEQRRTVGADFKPRDKALLKRLYTALLNYHHARGAEEALTHIEGEGWYDRFLATQHTKAEMARARSRAENRMNTLLLRAVQREKLGDSGSAVELVRAARDLLPDSPSPHFHLGLHYLETDQVALAEASIENCRSRQAKYTSCTGEIASVGDETSVSLYLALACMAQGKYAKAIEVLRGDLENHRIRGAGMEKLFLLYLARCCERTGLTAQAVDAFERVLQIGVDEEASHDLFLLYLRENQDVKARRVLERSVRFNMRGLLLGLAKDGLPTVQARNNGTRVLLHSQYRPLDEAERCLPATEQIRDKIIVQLGVGLGYPILALFNRIPKETPILAVERNTTLFHLAVLHTLETEWITSTGLQVLVGERDGFEFQQRLDSLFRQHPEREVLVLKHPPSIRLYPEYYERFCARPTHRLPGVTERASEGRGRR